MMGKTTERTYVTINHKHLIMIKWQSSLLPIINSLIHLQTQLSVISFLSCIYHQQVLFNFRVQLFPQTFICLFNCFVETGLCLPPLFLLSISSIVWLFIFCLKEPDVKTYNRRHNITYNRRPNITFNRRHNITYNRRPNITYNRRHNITYNYTYNITQ